MSPEALIGMELGKGVLQRLLGQGTMGAVYLANGPQGQMAVKVFLPASQLEKAEYEEFRKRLGQVIAQGVSLSHEHILGILNYGEQAGYIYQTMPYIAGENLQALLARSGPLSLSYVQIYLKQLAQALDYVHARNFLHRDVKPENILITPEGNLLLADFGLAGLTTEKAFARVRRATPGMLNYIAPEYVLNRQLDQRADLYSLGVVLYQMVTGKVPFQSTSLTEVAMQHVRATPPAPDSLRPDLPQAAVQVILRALAKAPAERYATARELASAFRQALLAAPAEKQASAPTSALEALSELAKGNTAARLAASRSGGLFDPKWQTGKTAAANNTQPVADAPASAPLVSGEALKDPNQLYSGKPQASNLVDPDMLMQQKADLFAQMAASQVAPDPQPFTARSPRPGNQTNDFTEQMRFSPRPSPQGFMEQNAPSHQANSSATTGMFKLNDALMMAQAPAESGRVAAARPTMTSSGRPQALADTSRKQRKPVMQVIGVVLAVLVVVVGSGIFWFTRQNNVPARQTRTAPNSNAPATATAKANIILADDLSQNMQSWPVGPQDSFNYAFLDGAYHITNHDKNNSAPALLANKVLHAPFAYSLTTEQIQGDLNSLNNQYGLILDATVQNVNRKQIETFYAFEVLNKPGGEYQFWKYDNSKGGTNPWKLLWHKGFGNEFLQGSGSSHVNTLKVIATGKNFAFVVNGTQVGNWQDDSFTSGSVGMLVNLNGAEVAFSHLLLTYA